MTVLREGSIEISLPSWASGRKFDNADHGLSHCGLKAVDFIIDSPIRTIFVEIKDPSSPDADEAETDEFVARFESSRLDIDLARKYRDSFLYEWAADRIGKPVSFYVLIALAGIERATLVRRSQALRTLLPVGLPASGVWTREIVQEATVFNMDSWNTHLVDFPVSRVTQAAD